METSVLTVIYMLLVTSIIHTILGTKMLPATRKRNIEGDKATHNIIMHVIAGKFT